MQSVRGCVKPVSPPGAERIYALEPSDGAFAALKRGSEDIADRVEYLNKSGADLPADLELDYVLSVGVVHHIPEPAPVLAAAYKALKPGGKCFLWLYGKEGNGLYLALFQPVRKLSVLMPHSLLSALCWLLASLLAVYIALCRVLPLPLRQYCLNVIGPMSWDKRHLVIYDQLNPAYAKYYSKEEARDLLAMAGFVDIQLHHRHGYSWSVIGTKPAGATTT